MKVFLHVMNKINAFQLGSEVTSLINEISWNSIV